MNTFKFHKVQKTVTGFRDSILTVESDGTLAETIATVAANNPDCFFIDYETKAPFCFRTPVRLVYSNGFTFWSDQETATLEQTESILNSFGKDYAEHRQTIAVLLVSFAGRAGDFLKLCSVTDKGAAEFSNPSIFNC